MKDLRNYALHYQLVTVGVPLQYYMTPEGMKTGTLSGVTKGDLSLRKEDLRKRNGLTSIQKRFFKQFGNEVPILGFVNRCHDSTKKLHHWLSARVKDLYSTEIKEFFEINSEIKRIELKLSNS